MSLIKPFFKITALLRIIGLVMIFVVGLGNVQAALLENAHYSKGLAAYLEEDYQSARAHWLNAAKANDTKSMFNLGLLHERKLIDNPDQKKADKWYRLAGKLGYGAADYHLALRLISRGDKGQAQTLLTRAAGSGFLLAQEEIGKMNVNVVANIRSNVAQTSVKENANGNYLSEAWIAQHEPTSWTIQMLAFKDLNKVHTFIQENQLSNEAAYFSEKSDDGVYYKLIYGVYRTKEQANKARLTLPAKLKQHGPWLRSIASVQAVIASR